MLHKNGGVWVFIRIAALAVLVGVAVLGFTEAYVAAVQWIGSKADQRETIVREAYVRPMEIEKFEGGTEYRFRTSNSLYYRIVFDDGLECINTHKGGITCNWSIYHAARAE